MYTNGNCFDVHNVVCILMESVLDLHTLVCTLTCFILDVHTGFEFTFQNCIAKNSYKISLVLFLAERAP